jgi:hypothetical protein
MVITLTNLPAEIEEALQRKAAAEGKPLDRVTVDVLTRGLELDSPLLPDEIHASDKELQAIAEHAKATLQPGKKRDLSFLVGTWVEDPAFDAALEEQRQIDPELWQ